MEENALQPTQKPQAPEEIYSPSELIAIFNSILSKQNISARIVYMRGIYLQNQRQDPRWSACFDTLRDEVTQDEITIKVTQKQRVSLKNGNMVSVGGVLFRQVSNKGYVQLQLAVSRIEVVKEQVIDENEIRRNEIRQKKAISGFKNVDGVLEQALFIGDRPKVALVFATVSITDADFEAGCKAAQSAIDFMEYRVNFASSTDLCQTLAKVDGQGFTAIAIVRGGGGGLEHLDDIKVLETVAGLNTPVIAAVGHVEEKVFIKQIVDKFSPTPNGLGAYFVAVVANPVVHFGEMKDAQLFDSKEAAKAVARECKHYMPTERFTVREINMEQSVELTHGKEPKAAPLKDLGTYQIPQWALNYMVNGEADGLSDEEISTVDEFVKKNFPNGYLMQIDWNDTNEFNRYPAFGPRNQDALTGRGESPYLATSTVSVQFRDPVLRESQEAGTSQSNAAEEDSRKVDSLVMDQRSRMSDMVVELRGETRQPWLTGKIDGTPVVAERLSSKEFSDYMAGKVAAEDLGLDHFKNYLDRSPEEKQTQGLSR